MLKIVHFTNTFAPMVGGLEKAVARLAADHTEKGHFCRIVTPAFKGAETSRDGVLRVPSIKGIGESGFSIRIPTPNRVSHWIEAIEPDIFHSHHPFMLGDTAWRQSRSRGCPLVFTHHTLYERYADWPWIKQERAASLLLSLTTKYANRCDLCIAPTGSIRDLMFERGIQTPIEVAPTGIDLEPFSSPGGSAFREKLGLPEGAPVVGHLGRIAAAKNMEFLNKAVCELLKKNTDLRYLLVGEGDRLQPALGFFQEVGLEDRVVSTGNLSGQDVVDAYAAMDVFLFASLTDTQGLVLAESMAAGTPIVALDAPGARDCIEPGKTGLLLERETEPREFAEAVQELLEDSERLRQYSEGARRHARIFDHKTCSAYMLSLYEKLIGSQVPRHAHTDSAWEHFIDGMENEFRLLGERIQAAEESFSRDSHS